VRCPFCADAETRVIDSRLLGEGDQVRRRRVCQDCSSRFTTYETAELNLPRVVKNDGRRETFDEEKLRSGILRALEKRPIKLDEIEEQISRLKTKILEKGEREVSSEYVGELVMQALKELDHVGYVRFASVYRSFEDVRSFLEEVKKLENELPVDSISDQLELLKKEHHS